MSLRKLSHHLVLATGMLASTWLVQQLCCAQNATPAPADVPATSSEPANSEESIDDVPIPFLLDEAEFSFKNEDFSRAAKLLEKAIVVSESEEDLQHIKALFVVSLFKNKEYLEALRILNDLVKSKSDRDLRLQRAETLLQAGWRDAALDELRLGMRLNPNSLQFRKAIAGALFSSPVPTGSDASEALTALLSFEDGIAEEPRIAGAIGLAAAGAGNFKLAVKMQKRYMQSLDSSSKQRESETLSRYEAKQFTPPVSFPAWDPATLLNNQAIVNIAHKSMVVVRVTRDIQLTETDSGLKSTISMVQTHLGTVLSAMGTILVSSETVRIPRFEELHGKQVAGSVKLLKEQQIELFAMSGSSGKNVSLGLAGVKGIDEPSGLAILEIIHEKHLEHVKYDELKAIQFMPEYRLFDPNTKLHLASLFEYSVENGSPTNKPLLREVTADLTQYSAYHDLTLEGPTLAKLPAILASQSQVGTPVFNQLGECVGITHEVGFDGPTRTVVIPSAVCTRIAAKLMSDRVVHRASLPIVVSGMLTGVREPLMGMYVLKVTSKDPIYKPLEGTSIVTVDGIATPTMTEWLMVLERTCALGSKTVVVEVYDPKDKLTTCMTVPVEPRVTDVSIK